MTDIQELFDRDPLQLTKTDIAEMIRELRERRQKQQAGYKSAGSMKTQPKPIDINSLD